MEITFDVFAADKALKMKDDFMHCADLFDTGKRCVAHYKITMKYSGNDPDKIPGIIARGYEAEGGYALFVGTKTPDIPPFVAPGIQTLSMLRGGILKWSLFADAIRGIGYDPTVDENMRVVGVKI